MRPDLVSGYVGGTQRKVDRYFYLFDEVSDLVWEMDGYKKPQAPDANPAEAEWVLLLMCPACHKSLKIDTGKKPILIDERGIETGEPIYCTWDVDIDGYVGMCPFGAELQPPKKPEYGEVRLRDGSVQKVKIDAFVRRALR